MVILAVMNNKIDAKDLQQQEKKKIKITADEKKNITHRGNYEIMSDE